MAEHPNNAEQPRRDTIVGVDIVVSHTCAVAHPSASSEVDIDLTIPPDPIDAKLKDIGRLDRDLFDILRACQENITDSKNRIRCLESNMLYNCKNFMARKQMLLDARAAFRESEKITIDGVSIIEDLYKLNSLYCVDDGTPVSAVRLRRFEICAAEFRFKYPTTGCDIMGYTIWFSNGNTPQWVHATLGKNGIWSQAYPLHNELQAAMHSGIEFGIAHVFMRRNGCCDYYNYCVPYPPIDFSQIDVSQIDVSRIKKRNADAAKV